MCYFVLNGAPVRSAVVATTQVRRKGKTFWLYVTIVALTIILILLVVSGL
jgi:hypothetical protein